MPLPVFRHLLTIAAAASVVVGTTAGVLWWRSVRGCDDRLSWVRLNGDRETYRSVDGRVRLFRPPPTAADPLHRNRIAALAAALDQRAVRWRCVGDPWRRGPEPFRYEYWVSPNWQRGHPGEVLAATYPLRDVANPLMRLLDDPDKAVAAHLALAGFPPLGWGRPADLNYETYREQAGEPVARYVLDGLRIDFRFERKTDRYNGAEDVATCITRYDLSNLGELRDRWHRRLDVEAGSVGYGTLVSGAAVAPGAWTILAVRRRRRRAARRRAGRCAECGFDLSHAGDRCPECGWWVPPAVRAAARERQAVAPTSERSDLRD